jgi:type I restriction enzyme S subunit
MIDAISPHRSYRDSGLATIGRVPTHWQSLPIRRLYRAVTRRDVRGDEVKMSMSKHLGLVPSSMLGTRAGEKAASIVYSVCSPGDLVMNKYQAHAGLFGCATRRGLITSNYTVFQPSRGVSSAYFAKLFASAPYRAAFEMHSYGVGDGMAPLYTGVFYRIQAPLPPPEEQDAIVRFLDHVNRFVDRYVRTKRRQLALLFEQKLVIVQQRVLGGLRARPTWRPSGIDWVGDIPADWAVIPTRHLFRPVTRRDITGTEPKMSMSRHLGLVRSDVLHANRAAQAASAVAFSVCHPGDLVVNKYQAHAGLFGAATERGLITANYSVFAPTERALSSYFALLYTSSAYRTIFRIASRGVGDGMMPLYTSAFHRVASVVPPLSEQREIVANVERETAGIAAASAIVERQLQQIDEYRTRLVADVVTGQLDVRAVAAGLPVIEPEAASIESEDDATDIEDGEVA